MKPGDGDVQPPTSMPEGRRGSVPPSGPSLSLRERSAKWMLLKLWPQGFVWLMGGMAAEVKEKERRVEIDADELERLRREHAKSVLYIINTFHKLYPHHGVSEGKSLPELTSDVLLALAVGGASLLEEEP